MISPVTPGFVLERKTHRSESKFHGAAWPYYLRFMKAIKQTITLTIRKADNSGDEEHDRLYYADVHDSIEGIDKVCVFSGDNQLTEFVAHDIVAEAGEINEDGEIKVTIIIESPEPK